MFFFFIFLFIEFIAVPLINKIIQASGARPHNTPSAHGVVCSPSTSPSTTAWPHCTLLHPGPRACGLHQCPSHPGVHVNYLVLWEGRFWLSMSGGVLRFCISPRLSGAVGAAWQDHTLRSGGFGDQSSF